MVRLGVAELPGWTASDVELARGGRSYTIDTLMALRTGEPASQFFFITGADAFAEVASWRRYPEVLDLAHFVVITRPGSSFDALRAGLPELRERFVECGAAPCRDGSAMAIFLVHADTPPISSTEIRRRACAGEPLDGLVPDPVRAYITEHRLYA